MFSFITGLSVDFSLEVTFDRFSELKFAGASEVAVLFIELCGSECTSLGLDVVESLILSTETSLLVLDVVELSKVSEESVLLVPVAELSEISEKIVLLVFEKSLLPDESEELPPNNSLFSLQAVRQTAARTATIIEIILFFIHSAPLYKPLQVLYDRLSLPRRLRLPQKSRR